MRMLISLLVLLVTAQAHATFKVEIIGLAGFPPGGTTGQVLAKASNTDYDQGWVSISSLAYISSLGAIGSTPSNAGASVAAGVLTLQPADATHGGVVSTATQTMAGAKTFSTSVTSPIVTTPSLRFTTAASDPGTPVEGQFYFNSTDHVLKFWNGSAWKTVTTD